MAKTPDQVLNKYKTGVQNGAQAYRDGVNSPRGSWSNNYRNSVDRMVNNFQRAVSEGRPQAAVQALGDEGFKQKTLAKADRYAQSATRAAEGYAAVVSRVVQAGEAGRSAAQNIQPTTWAARLDRVRANAEAIAAAWGKPLT